MLHYPQVKTWLHPLAVAPHECLVAKLAKVAHDKLQIEADQHDEAELKGVVLIKEVVLPDKDQEEEAVEREVAQERLQHFFNVLQSLLHVVS